MKALSSTLRKYKCLRKIQPIWLCTAYNNFMYLSFLFILKSKFYNDWPFALLLYLAWFWPSQESREVGIGLLLVLVCYCNMYQDT